jgi:hypothetical protein
MHSLTYTGLRLRLEEGLLQPVREVRPNRIGPGIDSLEKARRFLGKNRNRLAGFGSRAAADDISAK